MSDAYRLVVNGEALDASTAANRMFRRTPWWIRPAMRNRIVAPIGLKTSRDKAITTSRRIVFFPIVTETPERVVLGLDDKHLDFRVSVMKSNDAGVHKVAVSTIILVHNNFGKAYLWFVLPFHKRGLKHLLSQAVARRRI